MRGLNSPHRRSKVFDFLRSKKVDVALRQETRLKDADIARAQNHFYKSIVASADGTHTEAGITVMRRGINASTEKSGSDNEGRLAFCCTSTQDFKKSIFPDYV